MPQFVGAVLFVALCLPAVAGQDGPDPSPTPAERYQVLLREFQRASGGGALSDEERLQSVGRVYQIRHRLALKFVEFAEQNPQNPIAVEALMQAVWQVNTTPWPAELVGPDTAAPRALALLQRDYVRSEKLGTVCRRICYGFREEYETFLRAVLEMNPHRDVQALACLGLAHYLHNRRQRLDLVEVQPHLAREFAGLFGREYLARLQRQDRTRDGREAESYFEQAAEKYGDVNLPEGGTIAEKAQAGLYEIRHLSVGREAPDIVGEDQHGRRFKLSDYRGQVVLLDFWHEY